MLFLSRDSHGAVWRFWHTFCGCGHSSRRAALGSRPAAHDTRFLGTDLPGFTGILHTWGRQLQYHPHIHYIVPGGGLSKARDAWLPSRANFYVPVRALSPIYRAIFAEEMRTAGLLEQIDPQVWQTPWNVHSQAQPHGATAVTYLAPYIFKVAISNRRIVSLKDRIVTFTYRKPGSARPRTAQLDVLEFIRRFLQHVLPSGFMKVRHFGFMSASCAITTDAIRRMIPAHNGTASQLPPARHKPATALSCPHCGGSCVSSIGCGPLRWHYSIQVEISPAENDASGPLCSCQG